MKWVSPGSYLLCAVTFAAGFFAMHLAGWREATTVLCGTLPEERTAQTLASFQAVLYTFFYLTAVIVSPILAMAALVFRIQVTRPRRPQAATCAGR